MKKSYIVRIIIVAMLFLIIYYVHNLNTQNQKLTNSILSNIEDDLLQTRKQINQNIDLINIRDEVKTSSFYVCEACYRADYWNET